MRSRLRTVRCAQPGGCGGAGWDGPGGDGRELLHYVISSVRSVKMVSSDTNGLLFRVLSSPVLLLLLRADGEKQQSCLGCRQWVQACGHSHILYVSLCVAAASPMAHTYLLHAPSRFRRL